MMKQIDSLICYPTSMTAQVDSIRERGRLIYSFLVLASSFATLVCTQMLTVSSLALNGYGLYMQNK